MLTFLYLCDICVAPRHHLSSSSAGCGDRVGAAITGLDIKAGAGHIGAGVVLLWCCVVARVTDALLLCVVAAAATTGLYSAGDITLLLPRCPAAASQLQHRTGSCVCCELPGPHHSHSQHQARQEADLTKHFTLPSVWRVASTGPSCPAAPYFMVKYEIIQPGYLEQGKWNQS